MILLAPRRRAQNARNQTIQVLLAEAEKSLDRQLATIDGLDSKVGQLFQVVTVATTLLTFAIGLFLRSEHAATSPPWWLVLGAFGVALVPYAATWICVIRAFQLRVYYLPLKMDREHIRTEYLSLTKPQAQDQLLANYIESSRLNWDTVAGKARWVQRALYLAGIDIILLIGAAAIGVLLMRQ